MLITGGDNPRQIKGKEVRRDVGAEQNPGASIRRRTGSVPESEIKKNPVLSDSAVLSLILQTKFYNLCLWAVTEKPEESRLE